MKRLTPPSFLQVISSALHPGGKENKEKRRKQLRPTMTNFKLTIASGANPAAVLPVLLIATSVNEARPKPVIDVCYEDAPTIASTADSIVQFIGANKTASGTSEAIDELRATFPFLKGMHEENVCLVRITLQAIKFNILLGDAMAIKSKRIRFTRPESR